MLVLIAMAAAVAPHHHRCEKLYSTTQVRRAVYATYRDHSPIGLTRTRRLRSMVLCLRHRQDRRAVWRYWQLTRKHFNPPLNGPVIASWYDDAGATGCGFHATYGIATLNGTPCGGKVRICHNGCVTAVRDDSGPYVSGRMFDLNATVKNAIGCGDLCSVRYAPVR